VQGIEDRVRRSSGFARLLERFNLRETFGDD
jgi:hypothetical protein